MFFLNLWVLYNRIILKFSTEITLKIYYASLVNIDTKLKASGEARTSFFSYNHFYTLKIVRVDFVKPPKHGFPVNGQT